MTFLTYKKLFDQEHVDALTHILKEHGIDFEITGDRESLDSLYGDKHFSRQFFVKLKQEDFEKADSLLLKISESEVATVDTEHYLFTFTDEELLDVLRKPDEWNEFDYQLSKKILKDRGNEIDTGTIDILKKERINELAKPEEDGKFWIFAGYIFACLGGLLGIFIGWHLSTFKKTLPDGQRLYAHSVEDRRHGNRILLIGIVMLIVSLVMIITK